MTDTDIDWKKEAEELAAKQKPFDPYKLDRRFVPSDILDAVCERQGVYRHEVCGKGRTLPIVNARMEYVGSARVLTTAAFPEISRVMGRTSHSTLHHAHQRWSTRPEADRREIVAEIRAIALGRHGKS
jgi:chromosomal replication initiation ATPase DnaA